MRKIRGYLLIIWLFVLFFLPGRIVSASPRLSGEQDVSAKNSVCEAVGFAKTQALWDASRATYTTAEEQNRISVSCENGIYGIYIEFDRIPQEWVIYDKATSKEYICGREAFLHEYVDLAELMDKRPQAIELSFTKGTVIADVYVIESEDLPSYVQVWQTPHEEADLLLVSSHSDDEQLFFAGVLPLYAGEKQLNVQVAYVVQHFEANGIEDHVRGHEQLDGLWTVGVRNYPFISTFPDLYAESKNPDTAFQQSISVFENAGVTYEDIVSYLTGCIRKCRPQVVVSHDFGGEYGHGTHVVCARALQEAIELSKDENCFPNTSGEYGVWTVSKAYSHLYPENPIYMDYDTPLDYWNGKTAFEVSKEGFACHKSQHWTWFYGWMYGKTGKEIKKASEIKKYSPCEYGLYYTNVGLDVCGGDFMENIVSYKEQHQLEEQMRRERLLEEEKKRKEEELLALSELTVSVTKQLFQALKKTIGK